MRVGDDQLDPAQAAPGEGAKERDPERLGLAAPAVMPTTRSDRRCDAIADDHRDGDDVVVAPDLHGGSVQPDIAISPHSRDTWLLLMPSMPTALTSSSTERVEMPWT